MALIVNSDQTGVQYSAGALQTYAETGSKQVEVVGKDEKQAFTLMVGISMSGEVLPFQAIYAGKTVERHDGGEKARCIDGINTTIYYNENSHNHMI